MKSETAKPPQSKTRKSLGLFARFFLLPLAVFIVSAVAALFLFCHFRPELVASAVQQRLNASTGLPWRINGSIYPVISPSPGIEASDVLILAASVEQGLLCDLERPLVQAKKVFIYLDTSTLLSFTPEIRMIELDSPGIHLTYDENQQPLWLPLPATEKPLEELEHGTSDSTATGDNALSQTPPNAGQLPESLKPAGPDPQEERDKLAAVAGMLMERPGSSFPPMVIRNGSLRSYTTSGEKLLAFTNIEGEISPHSPTDNLKLSADFSLPDADLEISFSLAATLGQEGIPARGFISGNLGMTPPGSRTVSATFATSFRWQGNGRDLLLPDFRFVAEGDGLTANLHTDLHSFVCTGPVQLHKLSLPRWFGWGRSLPPGLQQPMDGLIGEFDLHLDAHSAEALNLRGAVGHLAVSGYVGVKDFSAPEVVVDLDVDRANLDLIFPFLAKVGKYVPDPRAPVFDHPVLAPYPQAPRSEAQAEDDPGTEVSYDVKVRVARPRVHDVEAGPLEVLVHPVRMDNVEKTRVSFDKIPVIKGTVQGKLDIEDDSIFMHYDVSGLELGLLPENLDNQVRIAGRLTGWCDITMPMDEKGYIKDLWDLALNGTITNCDITGRYAGGPWQIFSGTAKASGKGSIFSVMSKGIRIEGLWDIAAQSIKTSWNPQGKDSVSGKFTGGLHWPPIEEKPRRSRREMPSMERKGVERVAGRLAINGSLAAPLGHLVVPVKGNLNSDLNWLIYDEKITLGNIRFEGFGSYGDGTVNIDFSGKDVLLNSDVSFKMNPRILLREWDLLPPDAIVMPKVLTGRTAISAKTDSVLFDKLKVEADGAPITGEISWKPTEGQSAGKASSAKSIDPGLWTFRLAAEHLNLDNFFPPEPKDKSPALPSQEPWNLRSLKNVSLDLQLFMYKAKYREFTFSQTKLTSTLQRDRFSLHADIGNFYDGTATILFQGTIVPSASQISLRKGLLQMQKVALGKALYDYTKQQYYAGTADLVVDIAGNLGCNADIPAKLSGIWSMHIKDGLYPAFLTNEKSNLRNTFSTASASGAVTKGTIVSDNFRLSGPMVDMTGGGWLNMNNSELDINVSVTFAKVPTVPVRFYGSTTKPTMQVRGVDMVVETVQAAGVGVFTLVKNVLELPAHAVRGINSLVDKGGDKEK